MLLLESDAERTRGGVGSKEQKCCVRISKLVEGAGGRRGKWIGRGVLDGLAEMREA